jgi:hypothetical protein
MDLTKQAASAAALCLLPGTTACDGSPATATRVTSAASSAAAPPADPLSGIDAPAVALKAEADLRTAGSFELYGRGVFVGQQALFDLNYVHGKGCQGILQTGAVTFQLIVIGTKVWIKPDNSDVSFWEKAGASAATAAANRDRYLRTTTSSRSVGPLALFCNPDWVISQSTPVTSKMNRYKELVMNGHRVVTFMDNHDKATLVVTDTATPEYVSVYSTGSPTSNGLDVIGFISHIAPATITLPPAGAVVDSIPGVR